MEARLGRERFEQQPHLPAQNRDPFGVAMGLHMDDQHPQHPEDGGSHLGLV